jgi:hypothetical protein
MGSGWVESAKTVAELVAAAGSLAAGFWAVWTYHSQLKVERAKWFKELYEKFYQDDQLRRIRDRLDTDDSAVIARLVRDEPPEFTDYLNFFEFLGYFKERGQITWREVDGFFDYYLRILANNDHLRNYIFDRSKGFEKLRALLSEL